MKRRHGRIVIISDTHLGRPGSGASSADALRPIWTDADELIVNGDVAELADPVLRAGAARQIMRLQTLCEADNVRLTMLSGNHDPLLTDLRHLTLADGNVFVTHGDVLHPAISPWNATAAELRDFNEQALGTLDATERAGFISRLAAAQHASQSKWDAAGRGPRPGGQANASPKRMLALTRKMAATLWYWHVLPRTAAQFMREHAPTARFFVFGHIHRAGIWEIDGLTIINTGCFALPLKPNAVVIEDGELSVWPIQTTSDRQYTLGNEAIARYVHHGVAGASSMTT